MVPHNYYLRSKKHHETQREIVSPEIAQALLEFPPTDASDPWTTINQWLGALGDPAASGEPMFNFICVANMFECVAILFIRRFV